MGSDEDRFPGLRFDPAPGLTGSIAQLTGTLDNALRDVTGIVTSLLDAQSESKPWTGEAADAYRNQIRAMGGSTVLLEIVLKSVLTQLLGWSETLTALQREGKTLDDQAVEIRNRLARLKSDPRGDVDYFKVAFLPDDQAKVVMDNYKAWDAQKQGVEDELDRVIEAGHALKDRHDGEAHRFANAIEQAADPETYAPPGPKPGDPNAPSTQITEIGDFYSSLSALVGAWSLRTAPEALPIATVASSALSLDALIMHSLAAFTGEDVPTRTFVLDALGIIPGFNVVQSIKDAKIVGQALDETGKFVTYVGLNDLFWAGFKPITNVTSKIPGVNKIPGLG